MKIKILVIPFLMLLSISLSAQDFVSENKQWNVLLEGFGFTTEIFWIEGDSMVNSTSYKQIWVSYDSLSTSLFQGLVREADNKVYYVPPNMNEGVLYDFNLEIGDTTSVNNIFCGNQGVPITVIDIDFVEHFGITRKRWHIGDEGYVQEYWLEGIGSLNGPLYTKYWYCIVCPIWELLCFHSNDTLEYIMPGSMSCYYNPVGVNEGIEEVDIFIRPNPVKKGNPIIIETTSFPNSISIYNITGAIVKSIIPNNETSHTIETNNLKSGVYFLSVDLNGQTKTHKILVE